VPRRVDEVQRRPVVVGERLPDGVVAVEGDRIAEAQSRDLLPDVRRLAPNENSGV
jgi:hypothetical protein